MTTSLSYRSSALRSGLSLAVIVFLSCLGTSCGDDPEKASNSPNGTTDNTKSQDGSSSQAPQSQRAPLVGQVRDMQGRPAAGAKVRVKAESDALAAVDFWRMWSIDLPTLAEATTTNDGRFSIEVESGPLYAVTATLNGVESNTARVYVNRPFQLTIGAKEARPDPDEGNRKGAGSVSGRLTAKDTGKPIAGAVLRRAWLDQTLATSDASGAFRIGWYSKAKTEPVFVFAKGYVVATIPSAPFLEGKNTTFDLKLARGIGVRGRVVDAAGKPVAGLTLLNEDDILENNTQFGSVPWTTKTDEAGRWSFEEMKPGSRYWIRAITKEGATIELAEGRLAANAKQSIEVGDVATGPLSSVQGKVRRKDGLSIEQAPKAGQVPVQPKVHYVKLWNKKPTSFLIMRNTPWVPIDPGGNYRIPKLAPGTYELAYWLADDLETEVRTVTIGRKSSTHSIDVTVGKGREFRGLVVDENDKPIDGVLLRALPDWENDYFPLVPPGKLDHLGRFLQGNVRVLTKPDGTYLLTRIRSGCPIQLRLSKKGYAGRKLVVSATEMPPGKIVLKRQ